MGAACGGPPGTHYLVCAHMTCFMKVHLYSPHIVDQLTFTVENSAAYARKCSALLMESMAVKIKAAQDKGKDIKMPPLAWKNTYRIARAKHFGNAPDAEVLNALHLIEKTEDSGEYGSMAAKMREQLNYYGDMPSSNEEFEPSLLRASFQNPYIEYYNFGTFAASCSYSALTYFGKPL